MNLKNNEVFSWKKLVRVLEKGEYDKYEDVIVEYMNHFFGVITNKPELRNQTYVMKTVQSEEIEILFLNQSQIEHKLENKMWNGSKIFKIWKQHERRQEYETVVFNESNKKEELNLFHGFKWNKKECEIAYYSKDTDDGVNLYLEYIEEGMCNKNQELYQWFIQWIANVIQNPCSQVKWIPVIPNNENNNKILKIFSKLIVPYKSSIKEIKRKSIIDEAINNKIYYEIEGECFKKQSIIKLQNEKYFKGIIKVNGEWKREMENCIRFPNVEYKEKGEDIEKIFDELHLKALFYFLEKQVLVNNLNEFNVMKNNDNVKQVLFQWLNRGYHVQQYQLSEPHKRLRVFHDKTGRRIQQERYDNSWICEIYQKQLYQQYTVSK